MITKKALYCLPFLLVVSAVKYLDPFPYFKSDLILLAIAVLVGCFYYGIMFSKDPSAKSLLQPLFQRRDD